MIRNSKTPNLLVIGLVVIIIIISYNYYSLLQKNRTLKEALFINEEKISELVDKKAYVEKQNELNVDRIKGFEDKVNAHAQSQQKKDSEIEELSAKLKEAQAENDNQLVELNEAKDKVTACKNEKESELTDSFTRINKLKSELNDVQAKLEKALAENAAGKPSTNCDQAVQSAVEEFKKKISTLVSLQFNEKTSKKFVDLLNGLNNDAVAAPSQDIEVSVTKERVLKEVKRSPVEADEDKQAPNMPAEKHVLIQTKSQEIPKSAIVICSMPKIKGSCQNTSERYYYDKISERCLPFTYSGCEGNENNFVSLEECNRICATVLSASRSSSNVVNNSISITITKHNQISNTTTSTNDSAKGLLNVLKNSDTVIDRPLQRDDANDDQRPIENKNHLEEDDPRNRNNLENNNEPDENRNNLRDNQDEVPIRSANKRDVERQNLKGNDRENENYEDNEPARPNPKEPRMIKRRGTH